MGRRPATRAGAVDRRAVGEPAGAGAVDRRGRWSVGEATRSAALGTAADRVFAGTRAVQPACAGPSRGRRAGRGGRCRVRRPGRAVRCRPRARRGGDGGRCSRRGAARPRAAYRCRRPPRLRRPGVRAVPARRAVGAGRRSGLRGAAAGRPPDVGARPPAAGAVRCRPPCAEVCRARSPQGAGAARCRRPGVGTGRVPGRRVGGVARCRRACAGVCRARGLRGVAAVRCRRRGGAVRRARGLPAAGAVRCRRGAVDPAGCREADAGRCPRRAVVARPGPAGHAGRRRRWRGNACSALRAPHRAARDVRARDASGRRRPAGPRNRSGAAGAWCGRDVAGRAPRPGGGRCPPGAGRGVRVPSSVGAKKSFGAGAGGGAGRRSAGAPFAGLGRVPVSSGAGGA